MSRDDRSSEFTGVLGFFLAICTILVSLRCYCKIVLVKSFAADDYLSVLTLISFAMFCTLALLGLANGTGKKQYLIPTERYPDGMKWWWACEPTYVICGIFLKLSIGIFLLRIAVDRVHRLALWVCLITVEVYSVFFLMLFVFQCTPISFFWERFRGANGRCVNSDIVVGSFYGYSAISCITDWAFSIIPIFIVRKLQMSSQKKITVAIILGFCAIGSTATIVRLPYISGMNDTAEFLYSTTDVAIWSTCETGIGLATSAAATLRPLLRQVFGELSTTGESASRKQSRNWGGNNPSRSGYIAHSSGKDGGAIQLKSHDSKFAQTHLTANGDALSQTSSTVRLTEDEQKGKRSDEEQIGGIRKTVKITQT
ncbi:hypothetical protein BU24DRAFT_419111 [Aaosphaeria arxii CBS 175.79]|uniref:Rhodopsin domain-containing protein n=1 Tax=Aaosphaeria arxii CBS 175.79 TaxID=1450172 RepID=A0A6A5Y4Q5_9PLEO|nr:uncharacterized protein BU24DRAFT_419111 [Aaosphaeria arxii CBS 175.79]KAF2019494.1 hypothetical protein BU24DRAFT_419111 [Aaosphaeria arxii CBS 175.79]